jgi:hypothetical protein
MLGPGNPLDQAVQAHEDRMLAIIVFCHALPIQG